MTKGELVERLKPSWEFDAAITEIVRGEDEELRGVVTRYIVASNQLRSEAATALSEQAAHIEELEAVLRGLLRAEYESAGHGLTDCIDNHGSHYQSQFLANQIAKAELLLGRTEKKDG